MKRFVDDIFINRFPKIDLHGYDRDSARMVVEDFIRDSLVLGDKEIVIIHGIGSGAIKEEVHDVLRHNKNVLEYKTHNFNPGMTIVKLK